MKHIRRATTEEVARIRDVANFGRTFTVFAMDQNAGQPDIAVVKQVFHLDPVLFGSETNDVQKARFIWALEERMAGAGIEQYECAVRYDDERWRNVIKTWGGRPLNDFPEARFVKEL